MYTNIVRAVQTWRTQGVALLPSQDPLSVQVKFAAAEVAVPADLQFLYSLCGGMPSDGGDNNWFELWPPERCVHELSESVFLAPASGFLAFASGFLSAHAYCLRPSDSRTSSVFVAYEPQHPPELVASSLDQAFEYLLSEPKRLHLP